MIPELIDMQDDENGLANPKKETYYELSKLKQLKNERNLEIVQLLRKRLTYVDIQKIKIAKVSKRGKQVPN